MVRINGEDVAAQGRTLADYLVQEGYALTRIAVECNGQIVPKAEYAAKVLADGDVLEVVSFVGGG
ncbi:MAG: sulfur carrier protein ThiS [Lachnospiraceae bacterium]|nr:sulfur carrier protein ThiS [Lachnospiraceae bacterium]